MEMDIRYEEKNTLRYIGGSVCNNLRIKIRLCLCKDLYLAIQFAVGKMQHTRHPVALTGLFYVEICNDSLFACLYCSMNNLADE